MSKTKSALKHKKDIKVIRPDRFIKKYMMIQKVSPAYGYRYESMRLIQDLGTLVKAEHYKPETFLVDGEIILGGLSTLVEIETSTGFKVVARHANHHNRLLIPDTMLATKNYRLILLNTPKGEVFFNVVSPEVFSDINTQLKQALKTPVKLPFDKPAKAPTRKLSSSHVKLIGG